MCETNTCVCRYFLFALKPYTGIYSFRQSKQNSKAKHLCSALKLYPNIFFYFIHTCTLFRKAIPLHIHYILFRLFAQQQLTLPVLHNRIYANFSHQPFFRTFCHNIRRRCNRLQLFHCFAKQTYSKSQYTCNTQ